MIKSAVTPALTGPRNQRASGETGACLINPFYAGAGQGLPVAAARDGATGSQMSNVTCIYMYTRIVSRLRPKLNGAA